MSFEWLQSVSRDSDDMDYPEGATASMGRKLARQ